MPSRNVFMTSMYFFYPIHGLSKKCEKDFDIAKRPVKESAFVKDTKGICHYVDLNISQVFYYKYKENPAKPDKDIFRPVTLNLYLLAFVPNKKKKARQFFIVVNAAIDKAFSEQMKTAPQQPIVDNLICTEEDIINLKHAFYQGNQEGLFYPQNDPTVFFHSWLLHVINEKRICNKKQNKICLDYSITDHISATIDFQNVNTWHDMDKDTVSQYCDASTLHVSAPVSNHDLFCAGILKGDNNYKMMPFHRLMEIVDNSFTSNVVERTYVDTHNLVFYHWHHPFNEKKDCIEKSSLENLQYVYELCNIIYARHRLRIIRYWANQGNPFYLVKALTHLMTYLNDNVFHLEEADSIMKHIFQVSGVTHELETTKEICKLKADALNALDSYILNIIMMVIAFITLIFTITQILPDSMLTHFIHCCRCLPQNGCHCVSTNHLCDSFSSFDTVGQISLIVIIMLVTLLVLCGIHKLLIFAFKHWLKRITIETIYEIEKEED